MNPELVVLIQDARAGTLTSLPNGRLRFDYGDDYRNRPNATPISVSMPLEIASHADPVVTPWVWGLLPDNPDVLARWSRHFHVSAASAFALLGTAIGEDCAGAIRFCSEGDVGRLISRAGTVEWLTTAEVARLLRELRRDTTAWLGREFTGQFSLAGAQSKTALLETAGRWGRPSGATPTTHILKPGIPDVENHALVEHLSLDAASRAGLRVARTSIRRFDDEIAIVVTRYDRVATADGFLRVHQEDICQALSVHPQAKYESEGGPGALNVIRLFRRSMPARVAQEAIGQFVDALIWNWLIAGTDAHAKNYGLLLSGDDLRLAPLYDIASALTMGVDIRRLRMAMKVGGDHDLWAVRDRWAKAAGDWGLDPERLTARVRELASVAVDAFADAAADDAVSSLQINTANQLVEAVRVRVERCQRFLD